MSSLAERSHESERQNRKEWKMDCDRKRTRERIKGISSVKDFDDLLAQTMLNHDDIEIMNMIYKDGLSISMIADKLCVSESTIKRKHKRILMKMAKRF